MRTRNEVRHRLDEIQNVPRSSGLIGSDMGDHRKQIFLEIRALMATD